MGSQMQFNMKPSLAGALRITPNLCKLLDAKQIVGTKQVHFR